jgi:hypothetical protein
MNDNPNPQPIPQAVPQSDNSKAVFEGNHLKTLVRALARHAAAKDHAALVRQGVLHAANDNRVTP